MLACRWLEGTSRGMHGAKLGEMTSAGKLRIDQEQRRKPSEYFAWSVHLRTLCVPVRLRCEVQDVVAAGHGQKAGSRTQS